MAPYDCGFSLILQKSQKSSLAYVLRENGSTASKNPTNSSVLGLGPGQWALAGRARGRGQGPGPGAQTQSPKPKTKNPKHCNFPALNPSGRALNLSPPCSGLAPGRVKRYNLPVFFAQKRANFVKTLVFPAVVGSSAEKQLKI